MLLLRDSGVVTDGLLSSLSLGPLPLGSLQPQGFRTVALSLFMETLDLYDTLCFVFE